MNNTPHQQCKGQDMATDINPTPEAQAFPEATVSSQAISNDVKVQDKSAFLEQQVDTKAELDIEKANLEKDRLKLDAEKKRLDKETQTFQESKEHFVKLQNKENQRLKDWEEELAKLDKELGDLQAEYNTKRQKLESDFALEKANNSKEIEQTKSAVLDELSEKRKQCDAGIAERSKQCDDTITARLAQCDADIAARLKKCDDDIAARQAKCAEDIAALLTKCNSDIEQQKTKAQTNLATERERQLKELSTQLQAQRKEFDEKRKTDLDVIQKREAALDTKEDEYTALFARLNEIERREKTLERREKRLQEAEDSLMDRAKQERDRLLANSKEYQEKELREKDEIIENLRGRITSLQKKCDEATATFDRTGKDPEQFLAELTSKIAVYDQKYDKAFEASHDVPAEIQKRDDEILQLKTTNQKLVDEIKVKNTSLVDVSKLQSEIETLTGTLADREHTIAEWKKDRELRMSSLAEERNNRIIDIQTPLPEIKENVDKRGRDSNVEINELEWLENIYAKMEAFETPFKRRILYAFHTSLKNSEYSPLTVLAGISGTGKSLLPSLYADFGGLNFQSFPVQPNWDSPESLLGFFNSLTGKFEAQPLLKYLAQSQLWNKEYYPYDDKDSLLAEKCHSDGLKDTVSIVLLDEMNLAHIELYFADFLSKLEERRGKFGDDVPFLNIRITDKDNYRLPMGRNVLWVGTMNQDETTKSLSDKVLDRGSIIDFPRPRTLNRKQKNSLRMAPVPLLNIDTWVKWNETLHANAAPFEGSEDVITRYKTMVEEINESMSTAGRAIGHRVWQSMEMYMANYPLTRYYKDSKGPEWEHALQMAFEDQLVQKIMPKLRGVETSGVTMENCLRPILNILNKNNLSEALIEDYKEAMSDKNYGQFVWSSAHFFSQDKDIDLSTLKLGKIKFSPKESNTESSASSPSEIALPTSEKPSTPPSKANNEAPKDNKKVTNSSNENAKQIEPAKETTPTVIEADSKQTAVKKAPPAPPAPPATPATPATPVAQPTPDNKITPVSENKKPKDLASFLKDGGFTPEEIRIVRQKFGTFKSLLDTWTQSPIIWRIKVYSLENNLHQKLQTFMETKVRK